MKTTRISWKTTPAIVAAQILVERHGDGALSVARQSEERATGPAAEFWVDVVRILKRD